ncbi:MAG: hypothetical protein HZB72_04360 [Burkholderiales bacterium]|nr:hypothetical protein [Burkholderiales bacterium]
MWLILLEALAALLIFVFIIWWTMFSGRRKGERPGGSSAGSSVGRPAAGSGEPPRRDPG